MYSYPASCFVSAHRAGIAGDQLCVEYIKTYTKQIMVHTPNIHTYIAVVN